MTVIKKAFPVAVVIGDVIGTQHFPFLPVVIHQPDPVLQGAGQQNQRLFDVGVVEVRQSLYVHIPGLGADGLKLAVEFFRFALCERGYTWTLHKSRLDPIQQGVLCFVIAGIVAE